MRVGLVGAPVIERADTEVRPYGVFSISLVGADLRVRPFPLLSIYNLLY